MDFFTADTHFDHEAIISFCNRPFRNGKQMTECLVDNWNSVVSDEDTVFHLGDVFFCDFERAEFIYNALKGHKILMGITEGYGLLHLRGNHDRITYCKLFGPLREYPYKHRIGVDHLVLFHYPLLEWPDFFRGRFHLHGHTHGTIPSTKRRIDVGVDCWDYKPVTWNEIKERIDVFPEHQEPVNSSGTHMGS